MSSNDPYARWCRSTKTNSYYFDSRCYLSEQLYRSDPVWFWSIPDTPTASGHDSRVRGNCVRTSHCRCLELNIGILSCAYLGRRGDKQFPIRAKIEQTDMNDWDYSFDQFRNFRTINKKKKQIAIIWTKWKMSVYEVAAEIHSNNIYTWTPIT